MKKIFLCSGLVICLVVCAIVQFRKNVSQELIGKTIAKSTFDTTEENNKIFDEDKNITEQTYLISEKEIDIPILLYHEFYEEEPSKESYGVISTPEKFEKDITYIIGKGYTFISLDRVIDYKNGIKGIPEKSIVLTFDDGYKSNYTLIYPILKKYNVPAAIFIVGDMMEADHHFDWEIAKKMNDEGLVRIYTHGHSHIDMTKMDIDEFREKTKENLKLMEEKLGKQEHIVYSYPLGFYNDKTNSVLKELGVEVWMTTNLGLNKRKDLESGALRRDYIAYNFSNMKLNKILKGK